MVKRWRKQIEKEIAQFRTQEGIKMSLRIIPASCIKSMIKAGNKGDQDARDIFFSINHWMETADKAADDGAFPACGYCNVMMGYGEVSGWACLAPIEGGVGMMTAYCRDCIQRDPEQLSNRFMKDLGEVIGVEVVTLQ